MIVEANGGRIYAEVGGEGPPLFIPGYASTPMFAELVRLFGDQFTVIGHDVRGEGLQTDFPTAPYTLFDLADDSAGVLDALGFERAHYLGHSHTGALGLALALQHPDRVDRLVLTTTGPSTTPPDGEPAEIPEGLFSDEIAASERGVPDGMRRLSALALSPAAEATRPDLVDAVVDEVFTNVFKQPGADRANMWAAYAAFNVRDRLAEIAHQTLIVTTRADRMVRPSDSWDMWQEIPNSVLVALHGIGHAWFLEAPEVVAGLVKSFLRRELDPTIV